MFNLKEITLGQSRTRLVAAAVAVASIVGAMSATAAEQFSTLLPRSPALAAFQNFVPNAHGFVKIQSLGDVEEMTVAIAGLPPNTEFDVFVIQVPNAPFGMSWYQGDITTDSTGRGEKKFVGRFNIETFMVAPGVAPAPVKFGGPFPDASSNPKTNPIQMYHLGVWFNSPLDAQKAGGPAMVTPFNGEHNAGVQVINSSNFPLDAGPLRKVF